MKGKRGGEIEGHILRSSGRKDRHSKVYTSKGARDRRVRLSAHTAIQFYDVQDRLGFDRPSKAVDWLINKAKTAIDNLNHDPPLNSIMNQNSMYAFINNNNNNNIPDEGNCTNSSFMVSPDHQETDDNAMKSLFPTSTTSELGLSLHTSIQGNANNVDPDPVVLPFQETGFQRIDGWNINGGDIDSRVGFFMNSLEISQQGLFSQGESNLAVNPAWNHQSRVRQSNLDFESPLELGFRVLAPIDYGQEEPEDHTYRSISS